MWRYTGTRGTLSFMSYKASKDLESPADLIKSKHDFGQNGRFWEESSLNSNILSNSISTDLVLLHFLVFLVAQ